mgnify:CR=1 FL=1|jgi:putative redox protein
MELKVKWNGKRSFIGQCPSGHELLMDANKDIGGEDKGPRPTEALLAAIGGCTGIDVIMILEKMQQPVEDYYMEISGQRNEEQPRFFTDIHVKYVFVGDLDEAKVKRAVELSSTKYCGVMHSLKANITTSVEIIPAKK